MNVKFQTSHWVAPAGQVSCRAIASESSSMWVRETKVPSTSSVMMEMEMGTLCSGSKVWSLCGNWRIKDPNMYVIYQLPILICYTEKAACFQAWAVLVRRSRSWNGVRRISESGCVSTPGPLERWTHTGLRCGSYLDQSIRINEATTANGVAIL